MITPQARTIQFTYSGHRQFESRPNSWQRQGVTPDSVGPRLVIISELDKDIRVCLSASGDDHLDGNKREGTGRSGLYVDVENLKADGRAMVQGLIENWPDKAPRPSRRSLYVRADQVDLWRLWAASRFTDLEVKVNGTQHFSLSSSKNSADIAIATNAIADLGKL